MDKKVVVICCFGLVGLVFAIYFLGISNFLFGITGETILYGDIIAYYPFEGNASDSIGGGSGVLRGATFVNGKIGDALEFSGIKNDVDMGNVLNIIEEDFSLSAWIKTRGNGVMGIVTKQSLHQKGYSLGMYGGQVWCEIKDGIKKANTLEIEGAKFVNDGIWHYVVLSADRDGDFALYVDGELDFSESGKNVKNSLFNMQNLTVGSYSEGYHGFVGLIDEVKIWRKALSAEEAEEEFLSAGGNEGEVVLEIEPCTDSDGGIDYYSRGVCIDKSTVGLTKTAKDQCGVEIDGIYHGELLKEFSCIDGKCVKEEVPYVCEKGCSAGACRE